MKTSDNLSDEMELDGSICSRDHHKIAEQILQQQQQQQQQLFQVIPATLLDLPASEPIAGRKYDDLKESSTEIFDSFVGLCTGYFHACVWNPLTQSLLVCDVASCCIRSLKMMNNSTTEPRRRLILGDFVLGGKGNTVGKFMEPTAVDVSLKGEIVVSDRKLCRIQIFNGTGELLCHFGRPGALKGQFRDLSDVKFTSQGFIAIVDSGNHRIQVMTQTGNLVMVFGKQGHKPFGGELFFPTAMDISPKNGDFFVLDYGNRRIQRFCKKGKFICTFGRQATKKNSVIQETQELLEEELLQKNKKKIKKIKYTTIFDSPSDLIVGPNEEIIVCDPKRQILFIFSNVGICLHTMNFQKQQNTKNTKKIPISIAMTKDFLLMVMLIQPQILNQVSLETNTLPLIRCTDISVRNSSSCSRNSSSCSHNSSSRNSLLTTNSSLRTNVDTLIPSEKNSIPIQQQIQTHIVGIFGTCKLIQVGEKFEKWPLSSLFKVLSYLNYHDAIILRQVNHFFHRCCYQGRCQWLFFPFFKGQKTILKNEKCVQKANGFEKVIEIFTKWSFILDKHKILIIQKDAMEFENGFLQAISVLYGPIYTYQHEEILLEIFNYFCTHHTYKKQVNSFQCSKICTKENFIEIVTLLEENRHGFLTWQQMRPFSCKSNKVVPPLRTGHLNPNLFLQNHNTSNPMNKYPIKTKAWLASENLFSLENTRKEKQKAQAVPVDPARIADQEDVLAKKKAKAIATINFEMMEQAEAHQLDKLLGKLRNL
jgi:hypothetical protein